MGTNNVFSDFILPSAAGNYKFLGSKSLYLDATGQLPEPPGNATESGQLATRSDRHCQISSNFASLIACLHDFALQ